MWLIIVALLLTLKLFQFTEALVTWMWGGDSVIIFGTRNIPTKEEESEWSPAARLGICACALCT